jgi:hypothetical protein
MKGKIVRGGCACMVDNIHYCNNRSAKNNSYMHFYSVQAIKSKIGPSLYQFESNVVIAIPTSDQSVRVFPADSKDTTTQSPKKEVALYALVDISYDCCSGMVSKDIVYLSVPTAIQETVQAHIKEKCSGIRYVHNYYTNSIHTNWGFIAIILCVLYQLYVKLKDKVKADLWG